jgi:calcyphosin
MDDDRSGTLSRAEFEKACRDFKLEMASEDVGHLFYAFDLNKDGVIQYDEFLRIIRGDLNDFRQALVAKAFQKLDRNGNGLVEADDLVGVYNASKHPAVVEGRKTAEQVLGEFLETFETHHNVLYAAGRNDHVITQEEFTEYYTHVSASIDDDLYFSQMMNSSWGLSADASPYQVYERSWASKEDN